MHEFMYYNGKSHKTERLERKWPFIVTSAKWSNVWALPLVATTPAWPPASRTSSNLEPTVMKGIGFIWSSSRPVVTVSLPNLRETLRFFSLPRFMRDKGQSEQIVNKIVAAFGKVTDFRMRIIILLLSWTNTFIRFFSFEEEYEIR